MAMVLKLQTRVGLVFAMVLASLLLVLSISAAAFWFTWSDERHIADRDMRGMGAAHDMRIAVDGILAAELIYLKDPHNRQRAIQLYAQSEEAFERAVSLASSLGPTGDEALLERSEQLRRRIDAAFLRTKAQVDAGQLLQANTEHETRSGQPILALRRLTEDLYDHWLTRIDDARVARLRLDLDALILSCVVALVGIVAAVAMWRSTSSALVNPLEHLRRVASELAEGHFRRANHPKASATVELASLQQDFNRMCERLEETTGRLRNANLSLESEVAARTRELAEANVRLQKLVVELRTLDKLKSDFMAVMSHELLTPINFISGFGSSLEDELLGPLTDAQRDAVHKMLAGADRLTRMVRNTLEYTKLVAGELVVTPMQVDYRTLVLEVEEMLREPLATRRQSIEAQFPAETIELWADPDRTRQVLLELLDNASKFSPEGTCIDLIVGHDDDQVHTEISDSGIGIPDAALPHLFTPFYQVNQTSTRAFGGMGLGLAIAYHLVARMNGSLLVSARPGGGTVVRFSLPRRPARTALGGQTPHAEAAPRERG